MALSHIPWQPCTVEDYLCLPEDTVRYQLIEGEIVLVPSPSEGHQSVVLNIAVHLREWARRTKAGRVYVAPFDVYLSEHNVVQPDVLFVSTEHLDRLKERGLYGPPDLAVEVISKWNAKMDLQGKRAAYARTGIPEYWLVDPDRRAVEVLSLRGTDYVSQGVVQRPDTVQSATIPSLQLSTELIFRRLKIIPTTPGRDSGS